MGGGEDADHDLLVQLALEVAAEPVQDRVGNSCEAQLRIPGRGDVVLCIQRRKCFLNVPCVVNDFLPVGMVEGEERLWGCQLEPGKLEI